MIDWARMKDLKDEIGEADFAEVAAMFLEEADEVVARLTLDDGATVMEKDLHSLKGAALNLGFAQLAALCQSGEHTAAAGSTDIDLNAVRDVYAATRKLFVTECGLEAA